MGKQAKLKVERRKMRALKKTFEKVMTGDPELTKAIDQATPVENPPDLGVVASETIKANDKFGG